MSDTTDAKLSTKQRKSLKTSQFCGPGRSFPVNDCAHVRAAFRLLNRAKVSSSTKASIRSCVSRKNKSMGCGVNKQDSSDNNQSIVDLANSEEFKDTRDLLSFLEQLEESRSSTAEDKQIESLRVRAAESLASLRGQDDESIVDAYTSRSIFSLFDSILDHIEGK